MPLIRRCGHIFALRYWKIISDQISTFTFCSEATLTGDLDIKVATICYDTEWAVLRCLHSQYIYSWSQNLQNFAENVSCTCMISLLLCMGINLEWQYKTINKGSTLGITRYITHPYCFSNVQWKAVGMYFLSHALECHNQVITSHFRHLRLWHSNAWDKIQKENGWEVETVSRYIENNSVLGRLPNGYFLHHLVKTTAMAFRIALGKPW